MLFTNDWAEAAELAIVVAAGATGARILFCHHEHCHKLGRFKHGHYRLCHVHHPNVPSDGKIRKEHINDIG